VMVNRTMVDLALAQLHAALDSPVFKIGPFRPQLYNAYDLNLSQWSLVNALLGLAVACECVAVVMW